MVLIYLDAGHGGKDSGAAANGIKEKDIVLTLCKKIKALLAAYDCKVMTTRETDVYLSLDERTKKANNANADVFISIHINSAGATSARGFETYTYVTASAAAKSLQNGMHSEIIRAMGAGIEDRGKRTANFHVLRESKMKAVLTETLFISNPKDADLLKQDAFLNKVALGHVNGLQKFLGLKKIERPPQEEKQPLIGGKLYRVQLGAFEDKANADSLATDLQKQGYRPIVKYE